MQTAPSMYAQNRAAALRHVLDETITRTDADDGSGAAAAAAESSPRKKQRVEKTAKPAKGKAKASGGGGGGSSESSIPALQFYFGDFNFRLCLGDMLRHVSGGRRPTFESRPAAGSPTVTKRTYTRRGGKDPQVVIEKKKVMFADSSIFLKQHAELLQFDHELESFDDELVELPIHFRQVAPLSPPPQPPCFSLTRRRTSSVSSVR